MNFTKMLQQGLTFWEIMHRDSGLTQWSCQEAIMPPFKTHNQFLNAHVVTVCYLMLQNFKSRVNQ